MEIRGSMLTRFMEPMIASAAGGEIDVTLERIRARFAPGEPMRAFVTGGGGFIGRELVRQLGEAGIDVRAIGRSEASVASLRGPGAEVVVGDVLDASVLADALDGCDVAYHFAGDYRVGIARPSAPPWRPPT